MSGYDSVCTFSCIFCSESYDCNRLPSLFSFCVPFVMELGFDPSLTGLFKFFTELI